MIIPILATGGVVTARDSILNPRGDELERGENVEYRPRDPGLWKVRGLTSVTSVAEASEIRNGKFLPYPGGAGIMLLSVGTTYRHLTLNALTGQTADLVTGLQGSDILDATYFYDHYFVVNGKDRNRAINRFGETRFHGMLPNVADAQVTNDGTGAGFTLASGDVIQYWVEEQVRDSSGELVERRSAEPGEFVIGIGGVAKRRLIKAIQRGYPIGTIYRINYAVDLSGNSGPIHTVSRTKILSAIGALFRPVIHRPAVVNSDATHWAVFATAVGGTFPSGAEVGSAPIAQQTIEDFRTGNSPGLPSGPLYETMAVDLYGTVQTLPRWTQPPLMSMIESFDGSLVGDDLSVPGTIRWCFPDEPDAWPTSLYSRVGLKTGQTVRFIRRVGNVLVVGIDEGAWRFSKLPSPQDASFEPERVKEQIEGAHGGVSQDTAEIFTFGQGPLLAYASPEGIMATDSVRWLDLTRDIDWENTVAVEHLSKGKLIYNRAMYRLEFYFVPKGETTVKKVMYMQCHPIHIKYDEAGNPAPKITFADSDGNAVMKVFFNGQWYTFIGASDKKVYRANEGTAQVGGVAPKVDVITAEKYVAGIQQEFQSMATSVHHSQGAPAQVGILSNICRAEGQGDVPSSRIVKLDRRELTTAQIDGSGESIKIQFTNEDTKGDFRINFFALDVKEDTETERA